MSRRTDHPTRVAPPPRVETLEDVPGGQPNLLPVDALRSALHVAVDPWPNSDPSVTYPEALSLYWNDEVVDRKEWTSTIPDDDYFVEVPVRYLRHGEHELVYEIELYNGVRERSQPLVLTIDEIAPRLDADEGALQIPLYYQVITQKNETLDSDHRLVAVNPFSPGLPIPQVVESEMTPGYLLLKEVKVAAHITLDTWQYMSTDCRLRIQVTGISDSGAALYTVIDNHAVTPEEMQIGLGTRNELTVPLSFLNTLKDDSSMQVKAFISFDAGQTWPSTPNLYELTLKIDKDGS